MDEPVASIIGDGYIDVLWPPGFSLMETEPRWCYII
jgi:hypothetical protein